jgi:opacity protein-like surface antigen
MHIPIQKPLLFMSSAITLLATTAFAGQTTVRIDKNPAPPPEPLYGTGFYFGIDAGINAHQNFRNRQFTLRGSNIDVDSNDKVGFVGGLKLGYVFGTGNIRPAIEADLYYNGVRADLDVRVNGRNTDANIDGDLHSGAFIANFLLRFNCKHRFQPYIGAGVGGFYAESRNVEVTVGGRRFDLDDSSGGGFAWQLVAGADYYFSEKVSAFLEYKFLNYEDSDFGDDRLEQHIVVLGARWHL